MGGKRERERERNKKKVKGREPAGSGKEGEREKRAGESANTFRSTSNCGLLAPGSWSPLPCIPDINSKVSIVRCLLGFYHLILTRTLNIRYFTNAESKT
jgi:hypothetical protein